MNIMSEYGCEHKSHKKDSILSERLTDSKKKTSSFKTEDLNKKDEINVMQQFSQSLYKKPETVGIHGRNFSGTNIHNNVDSKNFEKGNNDKKGFDCSRNKENNHNGEP